MDNKAFEGNTNYELKNIENENKTIYSFEEAVTLQGHGKFHMLLLIVSGLCILSFVVEMIGISLILEPAKCELNFTIYEQGLLASAGFLGVVISSHAVGFLADTCGRLKTLKISILMTGIFSIISAFSVSVWMLSALRLLVGVFVSSCQSCVFSYLGEFHSQQTRSKSVQFLSVAYCVGIIYFPAIAIAVLPLDLNLYIGNMKLSSWRIYIIVNALTSLTALIFLQFCPESPKYLLVQGRHDDAIKVLSLGYSINMKKPRSSYPVQKIILNENSSLNFKNVTGFIGAVKIIWGQTIPLFRRERIFYTLNISLHQFLIYSISHGFYMWFPGLLTNMVKHMDENLTVCEILELGKLNKTVEINSEFESTVENVCANQKTDIFMLQIIIMMGFVFGLIYIMFAVLIEKVGQKRLLILWMVLSGVCAVMPYWSRGFYLNVILTLLVISFGNSGGIVTTIAMLYFPTNVNAMGLCLIMMIGRLGAVAGSNVVGIIITNNCDMVFVLFGCIIVCLIFLATFLPNNKKY